MIDTTVVIPYRGGAEIEQVVRRTASELVQMPGAGEILIVELGPPQGSEALEQLCAELSGPGVPPLRGVRLGLPASPGNATRVRPAAGLSAALTVAFGLARGEHVVVMHPNYSEHVELIPEFRRRLSRADLIVARPRYSGFAKIVQRIVRLPRYLLLGLEVRDPECLFWAARREAVTGLELPRGMYRYLSTLVAARGYRVGELVVDWPERPRAEREGRPNPGDLICAWWLKQRWPQYRIEWASDETAEVQIHTLPSRENSPAPSSQLVDSPRRRSA